MRKIFLCLSLVCLILLTGCGKKSEKDILKDFQNKVMNTDSYYLTGKMELVNNEDVFNYNISVSYKKEDYYKIELVNAVNDHKQIILRNDEGVYIVTPSLNKSFKFQSDWPYNNSQVYLLSSLLDDINNDQNRTFTNKDNENIITSTVNYPNNEKLVNQKIYFGSDNLPEKVLVMDKDGNIQIKMVFDKIDLNTEFNDTYFELNSILDTNKINEQNALDNKTKTTDEKKEEEETQENNGTNQAPDNSNSNEEKKEEEAKTKETATIDDIIYPMYLPANTYLTSTERVTTEDGERLILTFTGDSSFVLMEEVSEYSDVPEIINTYGDVELIGSSLAVINDNSANWFDSGIEYYIVSDVMSTDELLQVVRSISVLPVSK